VGHDPRPAHRMSYLDAIERRWCAYEALATNHLPLQFRDDEAIEAAARSLVADPSDREAYVTLRRAYREQRWKWLEEHPSRRRHQVVISGAGVTEELRALQDERRARQVIARLTEAVLVYRATFRLLVVDVGSIGLPELEVVSTRVFDLVDTTSVAAKGRRAIAIQHLRHGPGHPPSDYDLAVHFDAPFVERFFRTIRGFWFSALGQYRLFDPAVGIDGQGPEISQVTVNRLQECLKHAYA
jgi:hypothetical protein